MKPKRLKMKVVLEPCSNCGHGHTDWWKSTPPPGCAERRRRLTAEERA